ncbi:MAG: hypothetical protein GY854_28335 [Deltaproteobacteria bacterium]|nr:hypothetical protein [Deltaproteobacteria bacterium]
MMRPLIRHILNENDIQITVGCYRNYAYLFADLGVVVIASDHDDFDGPKSLGALDLSYLCPDDHIPINTWVGNYPELTPPSWPTIVETFNRQAREQGHPIRLKSGLVPDIDFRHMNVPVRENAIYIENGTVRSGHSVFSFDMQRLSGTFPALNFYCTAHPFHYAENMYNCSHLNLVELSALSNRCVALIGKGSGPFCCTLTDANRYKPRGIMRFHDPVGEKSPSQYRFWDYPGSPLEYLNSEDDLIGFLNRVVERRKTVLL